MFIVRYPAVAIATAAMASMADMISGQEPAHVHGPTGADSSSAHTMWLVPVGSWRLTGNAQLFPALTLGDPGGAAGAALRRTGWYVTQSAAMANLESPASRVVLRTTINFEGVTQRDGELTFGAWGEGFIDKRHPHTLLHELMLSVNFWDVAGGDVSLSAGKGFAPYGTDDPMTRPGLKYPTNHHLSQILERWTLNAIWRPGGWSAEVGLFGGAEPTGPYDFANIGSFADSWSVRFARRWGAGSGPDAEWEASVSYGQVVETHDAETEQTRLINGALRYAGGTDRRGLYALVEASVSDPQDEPGYFSILGELRVASGPHQPYARVESATRPEFPRDGVAGTESFFTYDHDADPIGATRWLIGTLGYAYEVTGYPASLRPYLEVQHHRVGAERGGIDPTSLFSTTSFWSLSIGVRIFLGGGPMRMGSYGVLDPMTSMTRAMSAPAGAMPMPAPAR